MPGDRIIGTIWIPCDCRTKAPINQPTGAFVVDYADPVVYRVSAADVIEDVNDTWVQFAVSNAAPSLATAVIGTSLWDHVCGDAVKRIYEAVLNRARDKMRTVSFPFRCDSPTQYRAMRLFVVPLGEGRLEFRGVSENVFTRPTPFEFLNPPGATRSRGVVRMCSWCKAIAVGAEWKPLETAIEGLKLLAQDSPVSAEYEICDSCLGAFLDDYGPEDKSLALDLQACITFSSRWPKL